MAVRFPVPIAAAGDQPTVHLRIVLSVLTWFTEHVIGCAVVLDIIGPMLSLVAVALTFKGIRSDEDQTNEILQRKVTDGEMWRGNLSEMLPTSTDFTRWLSDSGASFPRRKAVAYLNAIGIIASIVGVCLTATH